MKRQVLLSLALGVACFALLSACSDTREPIGGAPHALGKALLDPNSPSFHGESSFMSSYQCAACHDVEKDCSQCHFGPDGSKVPPGVTWTHGTVPHDFPSSEAVCNACHSLLRSYGEGPGSCHDCHAAPHALGEEWIVKSADFHGNSSLDCSACHDEGEFCSQCHFGPEGSKVPPGVTWTHGTIPHDFPESEAVCNACHSLLRSYGEGPGSCHDCHGAPHVLGAEWILKSADFHGNDTTLNCEDCHSPLSAFCTQCHFDAQGSRTPAGVKDWSHDDPLTGHAATNLFTAGQEGVCVQCHGLEKDYTGEPAFTDCSSTACHPTLPAYHGQNFIAEHPAAAHDDLSSCAVCHNTPGGTPNFDGYVTGGPPCTVCHSAALAHPPPPQVTLNWYIDHRTAGGVRIQACGICHDVTEGREPPLPSPSCFSADFGGQTCHPGGPGTAPHPVPFWDPALHGPAVKAAPGFPYCQTCHADPATGANPRFDVAVGSLTKGCETCHATQTAHPSVKTRAQHWFGAYSHADAQNLAVSCAVCHGANLGGPADGGVGPPCSECHTLGSPLTAKNCTSCHGNPPNGGNGAAFPNRPAAHATHNALAGVAGNCGACHTGAGDRTAKHYNGAVDAAFPSTYNAKSGAASATITAGPAGPTTATCANVSCHGGKTTPNWLSETIDVNTQCTACHAAGTSQYNSYNSGRHDAHGFASCTVCHNTTNLAVNHFTNLQTPAMEGPASATIGGGSTLLTSYTPGATAGTGSCSPKPGASVGNIDCHGTQSWTGD